MQTTLSFPEGMPSGYLRLTEEPPFNANRHLALQKPAGSMSLESLGYSAAFAAQCPSPLALSAPFRVFSDEGLAVIQELAAKMKSNRNAAAGTGKNRLGSYIRGAGYRSQFIRDFCDCPEWLEFVSDIAGVPLARHSVPAVACGINYAPEDISRAVDTWHVDSVSFDAIIMLTPPEQFRGGEFQYFSGAKEEGEQLLGTPGEEGTQTELPSGRIKTVRFPAAGWGFLQQGNLVFHRACRLLEKAERITLLPSFVISGGEGDGTNVDAMRKWGDPGLLTELARHEAWRTQMRLQKVIDELPLGAPPEQIADELNAAADRLRKYAGQLKNGASSS